MKVGVLSDTHGRVERVQQALTLFDREAAQVIFHCGDVGGMAVLEQFVSRKLFFVWGNIDRPDPTWRKALQCWELPWPECSPLRVELADRTIVLAHGHEPGFTDLRRGSGADFLFCGHSHQRRLTREGQFTTLNPGALHQASPPSIAVVDLISADAWFFDLQGNPLSLVL